MNKNPVIRLSSLLLIGVGIGLCMTASPMSGQEVPSNVKRLFAKRCIECHKGNYPPQGLNLEEENVLSVIDAPSKEIPTFKIINTSDPEASYMLKKVTGGEGITGKTMPPGNPLPKAEIEVLKTWLLSLKK